jgi:hypothetical protein
LGKDWSAVLTALDPAGRIGASKAYAAYFNYGAALEGGGDIEEAVQQYQAAFSSIHAGRKLWSIDAAGCLPQPTPSACLSTALPAWTLSGETPDLSAYVTASDQHLVANGEGFEVRGVITIPDMPLDRFITQADLAKWPRSWT